MRDKARDDNGGLPALPVADSLKRGVRKRAAAMEAAGYKPMLLRGRESNLKVVYPEDLPLAEFWLSRQECAR